MSKIQTAADFALRDMSEKIAAVNEAARSAMEWEAQMAAEKHQREVESAENIRRLAEDSRLARESAAASDKKSKIAIWIAVLSMAMTIVAICVAHHDSEQTTKAIVDSIQSLKGVER